MDNIQLYHIDNEINKVDEMKEGDVIYKNGVELLVVLSYDHNEPCKGCFFYEDKACGSERLIKCWDCKKEYIFTAIRKYNTTELCGIVIGAAKVLRELADKNLLILYTVRDGKYLQDAVDWFKYNHINLYSVNYNPEPVSSSPKVYCDYYIDDRNIGTPLTDKGYVDWNKMLVLLRQNNLL